MNNHSCFQGEPPKNKLYKCSECGLSYQEKKWADKCEEWCRRYKSCNLEITNHAVEDRDTESSDGIGYTCPMHPEINQSQPGMCPECGMALIVQKAKREHNKPSSAHASAGRHAGHSTAMFLKKFWVSLILSIPVILYSDFAVNVLKINAPEFPGSKYLSLVLGTFVFFYAGMIFLTSAWREIRAKLPGMMTLIALAIITAYTYSVYVVVAGKGEALFWELTTLITIMLLGHWIEMKAVSGAQGALKELSKLLPDTAEVIKNGEQNVVPINELRESDIVFVRPGGRIPADGLVIEGKSDVNESMITGESALVPKKENSEVIGGTVNGDGSLKIKITKVGEETFLSGVMRLVRDAQSSKSKLQILSDRAAFYLTIIAVGSGALAFVLWLLSAAGFSFALERLVAVLVIACPHALGLAVPLVASISTTKAAQNGFLIRDRLALEMARNIDVVLFDKTGTLTEGAPEVQTVKIEKKHLETVLALEQNSQHPLAKAITEKLNDGNPKKKTVKNFQNFSGRGVVGLVDGKKYILGNYTFLKENGVALNEAQKGEIKEEETLARTVIMLGSENQYLGFISLSDKVKETSKITVESLKKLGIKTVMLTGDNTLTAQIVAKEIGIDEFKSKLLPKDKVAVVKDLQLKNNKVAMVGDGINDAPALVQADLGVAIGAGTNVAIESAGIILVKNDPRDIVRIIKLSKLTYSKMIQNLFWAAGYNIVAIPLAAGILISKGITLEPAAAAVLMSLSTVIVSINAVLLRKKSL